MYMQSWGKSSYARAMIKLQVDVELKDTLVVAMPKLVGDGFYMWTIRVKYEWEPPRCLTCNVSGHVLDDYPKRINFRCLEEFEESCQATKEIQIMIVKWKKYSMKLLVLWH
uniref:Zinc knuckle CX2CX4HX4C n=1 Tax=Tanacetum cinerariifolium TaxID=118510 RepID=A0A699I6L9_TANCI|nr:hypothetical protein [Tanacetum cinerariifolium]